ncbi:hypothetical protein G9A89_021864 [Geosiphon pyriformis]|nr:hypothetical protein G9A89_021864 [Geosiphon pyriformis]
MKKSVKGFSVDTVSKDVASRKKRKRGVLKNGVVYNMVLPGKPVGGSWGSEAGNTTESDSVNMEEEFWVEKTSVNYGEGDVFERKNNNQTPKGPRLVTKQALGKPLSRINFLGNDNDDDILLDEPVVLLFPLKKLVDVFARKSFALDVDLVNISGKSAQDKLAVVRKLFSKINGFGGASILSKFSGIIQVTFTSESCLIKATKLAADVKILVNTDLKKSTGCSDWAVVLKEIPVGTLTEAVHTVLAEFGAAKWSILIGKNAVHVARSDLNKMTWDIRDHYRVLLYTFSMRTNTYNIWNFIGFVDGKTCVIDRHPVTYVWTRCAIVCFELVKLLDAIMRTTPMLKSAYLHWFYLGSAKCAKCGKLGHTFLDCVTGEKPFSGGLPCRVLSDVDKSRLTAIYAKRLVPVAHSVSFGGVLWAKIVPTLQVSSVLNDRFAALECSLASLAKHVNKLAKRLNASGPTSLGVATGGETVVGAANFDSSVVSRMEETLRILLVIVMSLSARLDNINLVWKFVMCNIQSINVPAKQKDIVHWHKKIGNLIKDRFDGVWVFTSGLDTGFLGAGVAIIMDVSLTQYVSKISKVPGRLLSIKLLFKNKLSVSILGLYAGAFSVVQFFQAANATMFSNEFAATAGFSDLDAMWDVVRKIMVFLANEVFKKKWFKDYNDVFTKESSKFHKLELLVSRLVKTSQSTCHNEFISLLDVWGSLDDNNASIVRSFFLSSSPFNTIWSAFSKVILDYLVVNNELILESGPVVPDIPEEWYHQYKPLSYVFDEAFWSVMQPIKFLELFGVVSDLLDGKAASLSGISNKLWKHCDRSVLDMLLMLLNFCLSCESVPERVLMNTQLIALIKTAYKILFKILSDRISLAYSTHDILHGDNFSVLKGTTTQTPIFAIGLVVEDALKKNRKLWLEHLEKCLVKIKMCGKFIWFFGNIHRNWTNRVMTNFGLFDGYHVHDGLDQGKVFSPLLWCIFYDPLLCEVRCQKSVYNYRLNSHFVSRSSHTEFQAGFSFFFAARAFVDDTIWVGSSQAATQYILNIASEFFRINNILINNDKTVAIPINSRISNLSFFISSLPISIAKKGKSYHLAKAHLDVHFFSNLVLKKAVSDKQFLYLVSAVLHSIISYRTQFSFVSVGVCNKWDILICKSLKLKSGLPFNFSSDTIYHPSFYGLKSFSQCQSKSKIALLISFANFCGVLGQLFSYKFHNLQVLINFPAHVCVSASNNFLLGVVCILFDYNLSLGGSLASAFWLYDGVSMFTVLDKSLFFKFFFVIVMEMSSTGTPLSSKRDWILVAQFLSGSSFLLHFSVNICESNDFVSVRDHLSQVGSDILSVYMDGSLKNLGILDCQDDAAAFFEDINLGLGVSVRGLISSTLAKLQAIALALEYMPKLHSVRLFSDSQAALDACKSELGLMCSDFCNWCWVECQHIRNVICSKNLKVSWHKVKGHSGILGNEHTDGLADAASFSDWFFSPCVSEHFLVADGGIVSGNSRHFVQDVFQAVCHARWEVGSGSSFLVDGLLSDVDWLRSSQVWHPDSHMATSFTSRCTADSCTYFMKALYYQLPVAVRKRFYDKCYLSVLCLYCTEVEISDHVFSYMVNSLAHCQILNSGMLSWKRLSSLFLSFSCVLQLLSTCAPDFLVSSALFKSFVFNGWFSETVSVFHDPKVAGVRIIDFAYSLCLAFRDDIWLVRVKHHLFMKKCGLIPMNGSASTSISGSALKFSTGVIKLLGMSEAFGVCFGFCKHYLFFSGIDFSVSVVITA